MKRTALALSLILALLLSSLAGLLLVNLVSANFIPTPALIIESPYNGTFSGERGRSVPLNVEVHVSTGAPAVVCISYSIDEGANVTFTNLGYKTWYPSDLPNNHDIYYIKENLDNLSDGSHTLRVYSRDANGNEMSDSVEFTVDTHNENSTQPSTPTVTPKPTTQTDNFFNPQNPLLLIIIGFVVVVGVGLLVYFKKRRQGS